MEAMIQKAIKPTVVEKKWSKILDKFNKDVVTSLDSILQYEDSIYLKNEDWNLVNRRVESIKDVWDSLTQVKEKIFRQYDDLRKKAWQQWVVIETNNALTELVALRDNHEKNSYIDGNLYDFDWMLFTMLYTKICQSK